MFYLLNTFFHLLNKSLIILHNTDSKIVYNYCTFVFTFFVMHPPSRKWRYIALQMSVCQSNSNFVLWLVMTNRWLLLNLGFLGQRSRSLWDLSLEGHTCFTNISKLFYFVFFQGRWNLLYGKYLSNQVCSTL